MSKTPKEDLLHLVSNSDLSPEAIEEIRGVVEKHTGKTHDEAMATLKENPVNEGLIKEIAHQIYSKTVIFTLKSIKTTIESMGVLTSFKSIEIAGKNQCIVILVDKNGVGWVIPDYGAKFKDLSEYFDYFNNKEDKFDGKINRPASGEMKNGKFVLKTKGKLGPNHNWDKKWTAE